MKIDNNINIWFTADLHFDHKNILKLQPNRQHETVNDMNNHILSHCNSVVAENDIIFILGDISFSKVDYLSKLSGNKVIIRGNHDFGYPYIDAHDYLDIAYRGQRLVLFHYPIVHWNGADRGSWHLHGHTHGSFTNSGKSMDVGWDTIGSPYSFDDVAAIMETKENNSRY